VIKVRELKQIASGIPLDRKIDKSDITNLLNTLEPYADVKTFNSHKKMSRGAVDFVDHLISFDKIGILYMIEVKLYKDVLSEGQSRFQKTCLNFNDKNSYFRYRVLTEKNYVEIYKELIKL